MKIGRRVLAAVIVLCMMVGLIEYPKSIHQAKAAVSGNFQYELLTDGTISIMKYTGTDAVLAIPGQIDGKTVTKVGERAFQSCGTLIELTFPDSVDSIGLCAFASCTSLQKITFPSGLKNIGVWAFGNCDKLTEINIPDGVTSIGTDAFRECPSLRKVVLPDSVASIGEYAFRDCTSLAEINFPEALTSIEQCVLQNCQALTEIHIPDRVTNIGKTAFQDCKGLTEVVIPSSVTSIGDFAFNRCESLQRIVIPDSVTQIGDSVFMNCKSLTEIVIPDSVTQMGLSIFSCCEKMLNVTISKNLTVISGAMFECCSALKEIRIPEKVTSIEDNAFLSCIGLSSVYLPKSVTSIKGMSFFGCSKLKDIYYSGTQEQWNQITIDPKSGLSASVTIHYNENSGEETDFEYCGLDDGTIEITKYNGFDAEVEIPTQIDEKCVTRVGEQAFYQNKNLVKVSIPVGVTSIGEKAFGNCNILEEIAIPKSVISIDDQAFGGCSSLQEILIPDSVISIGRSVFYGCSALQEITIPDSVISIGGSVFFRCSALRKVILPEGITSISSSMFYKCGFLQEITIPKSVTSIKDGAFLDCSGLQEITIPEGVTSIGGSAFQGCSALQKINIPSRVSSIQSSVFQDCSALQEITIPNRIAKIEEKSFYGCNNLTHVYYDGTKEQWNRITIDADSGLENERITIHFKETDEPESDYEYQVLDNDTIEITKYTGTSEAVTIPVKLTGRDVTKIARGAFSECENIKEIKIPASLTDIHREAFKNCPALTDIYVDEANENYCTEDGVLLNKTKTELIRFPEGKSGNYTIPSGVVLIGEYAFYDCRKLTDIKLPDGITKIGNHAFYNSTELADITIPESVSEIGSAAFGYCRSLKKIFVPKGVRELKSTTFFQCKGLEEVELSEGVSQIGAQVFLSCDNLKSITIPVSVTKIERDAFWFGDVLPDSLTDVYYGGTKEQWEQIEVQGTEESVSERLKLTATIHCKNSPIVLPEEPIQPEVRDPKQELDSLKSNGSFQLDEFAHYLTEEQINILEDYLYTWLAQVNHAYQYAGSSDIKELMMKKAGIDPDGNFASGTEQAITHISVDTPYGTKTLEITMGLGQPESSGNLYLGYSVMHYEILEKNGIPSDVPVSGQIVRNGYTDMGAFVESVKQASNDSLHSVYQWQQLEPETAAGILIDKATAEIVGNKNGSFADGTFTIYAKPLFAYSKIVKISCPVDVHVYGMDGKEAGSIVNNQPSGGNQHVRLDMDGETKTVYLAGEDYYLNLRGTGTGKMKYEVEEIANEEVRRNVQFLELQLKNDMLYEGYVFRPLNIDRDLYALRAVEKDGTGGEVFHSNQDSYQSSFKKVQGLSLSQKNTSLESDRTIQLSASYFPLDASNPNLRWTTNNASVARVDENGLITAVGSGQATVTVSTKDGSFLKQYCVIDVSKKGDGNGSGGSTGSGSENNGGNGTGGSGSDSGNNGTGSGDGNGGNNTTPGDSINGSGSGSSGNGTGSGSNGSSGSSTSGNSSGNGSDSSTTDGQDRTPVVVSLHYVLQFHANGGTNLSRRTMTLLADDNPGIMPKVQRKDYTFDGWYTKQEGGKRITGDDPLTEASTLYARWTKTQAPAKVSALTVKSKKKGQLQASFQKVKGAAGYQVAYSGSKKFTSAKKKEAGANVKTKTITGLKAGKKYYIKVRAYRVDSAGNRVYGAYSAVKSVKTKA